jgi:hypothetical protein
MHKKFIYVFLLLGIGFTLINSCASKDPSQSILSDATTILEKVDFIFHVKPILSDRCFKCHGPDEAKVEAGLQLHIEEKAFTAIGKNKDRYAIIKGDPENSEIVHRIFTEDAEDIMPPPESNLTLTNQEKEILKKWIEQGAEWKQHWAFALPENPEIPQVQNSKWVSNPIDNFILHKLEENNLQPNPEISSEKLLRKVSFDLTGLPPSLEDIEAFISDPSSENYERIIDKYLKSDAFAERMTNGWLDLARYADTHGYQDDLERIMWPWRDWVIHAFKQNMPYDQFVTWQLAGDLLPNATKEQIIATAFNRNHKITQEGGVIPEEYRSEYVTDRTNTFGTAFLGLTLECAKCHDHKYDPISQKDYFQLYGYFNSIDEKGLIESYGAIPEPYINITKEEIEGILGFINNLDTIDNIPLLVMKEVEKPRKTYILNRGMYDQPTKEVVPAVPGFGSVTTPKPGSNRLDLAKWLFSDKNPLTARVTVNRLWQQIFGKGIVATSYDFGNQGSLPSHPELLDHLALKFKNDGWDVRALIKYLVTTSTYKQGSRIDENMLLKDPDNNLMARSTRSRLSAEMLRDHALSISGLLVDEVGGPSVKPYQPEGLWNEVTGGGGGSTSKYIQDEGDKNYRRSLYTFWKRTVPPPNMLLFDTPTRDFCMVQRENTSTPLQALVLMNDPQFLEASKALAYRAINNIGSNDENKIIQHMFTLATSRMADENELSTLSEMYADQLNYFKDNPAQAVELLKYGSFKVPEKEDKTRLAAYSFVANAIFNLDETIRKT